MIHDVFESSFFLSLSKTSWSLKKQLESIKEETVKHRKERKEASFNTSSGKRSPPPQAKPMCVVDPLYQQVRGLDFFKSREWINRSHLNSYGLKLNGEKSVWLCKKIRSCYLYHLGDVESSCLLIRDRSSIINSLTKKQELILIYHPNYKSLHSTHLTLKSFFTYCIYHSI